MLRVLFYILICVDVTVSNPCTQFVGSGNLPNILQTQSCLRYVSNSLKRGDISELENLEEVTAKTVMSDLTLSVAAGHFFGLLYRVKLSFLPLQFNGVTLYLSNSKIFTDWYANTTVNISVPSEVPVKAYLPLAACVVNLPQNASKVLVNPPDYLYDDKMFGLSVKDTTVTGLKELVNISIGATAKQMASHRPQCVFLNYTTQKLDTNGCSTQWDPEQSHIVCSCDHFTFFAVLMISTEVTAQLTQHKTHVDILTYMTFIGCSISFCALLIAVLLYTIKRNVRSDVSMKIHVNLSIALLLLNMHFLPNTAIGIWDFSWPSPWLCFYLAIALHYFLLASFSWMAVEGFHLYLLLVKVFNIHVKRYLLKASLVGWGVPVVVVGIVVAIKRDFYGAVTISKTSNSTKICYVREDLVNQVTTLGLFCLVFLFNVIMLIVTVKNIVGMRRSKQFGPNDCNRAKKDVCTLLGVITLLGTTWGLIFFSFGQLPLIGVYAFTILNPLQGLFIFVWFVLSVVKISKVAKESTATQSSH